MRDRSFIRNALVGACLASTFGTVCAADSIGIVSRVEGRGFISQGSQYRLMHQGMKVRKGDRLMVMEDSSAVIDFDDNCRYTMSDNEVLTVGDTSTCAVEAVHRVDPGTGIAHNRNTTAVEYRPAAISAPAGANLGWVPAAAAAVIAILNAVDTGGGSRGHPPSPS